MQDLLQARSLQVCQPLQQRLKSFDDANGIAQVNFESDLVARVVPRFVRETRGFVRRVFLALEGCENPLRG
jgi:hypothetical protein